MNFQFTSQFIFWGSLLALLCVFASILSRRLGAPLLLVFLVLGMLAGEDGPGGIVFNNVGLSFLLGNLALAIIIFDGGLGTRTSTFRVSLTPALSLATLGVIITAAVTGVAAKWILDLAWYEALLIGAVVGSTDAAAVFGLLRFAGLELKERTGATLEIESGTNDPMAIFLTLTLVQLITLQSDNVGLALLSELLQQLGLGLLGGFAGGYLLSSLIQRLHLPVSLYPLFALAGALSAFGLTNLLGGSGFLAIYIVGVLLGNRPLPHEDDIHRFHDGVAWLSQIGMFLMLGLLITPSQLLPIIVPAVAIALVLIFVARPLAVWFCLLPFHFPWREQVFIGWCGLRGAVPIILALFPSLAGLEHTETFFELVFFVVLISLLLQGWTIAPMARWLGVELPPSHHLPEHLTLRIEKESANKELHIYDVVPGSKVIGTALNRLPLSENTQLLGLLRKGVFLPGGQKDLSLSNEDQVVVLLTPGASMRWTALFAPPAEDEVSESRLYFGEFVIAPDAGMEDLAMLYGFDAPATEANESVASFLSKKFHGKPVVGDRVPLGQVQFVVREIREGKISAVGLKLKRS